MVRPRKVWFIKPKLDGQSEEIMEFYVIMGYPGNRWEKFN